MSPKAKHVDRDDTDTDYDNDYDNDHDYDQADTYVSQTGEYYKQQEKANLNIKKKYIKNNVLCFWNGNWNGNNSGTTCT